MRRFIKALFTSKSGQASLFTISCEILTEMLGLPGLGAAVGWTIASYLDDQGK